MDKYKDYEIKQDNKGSGMFAVIPTYTVKNPKGEKIGSRLSKADAKLLIDAKTNLEDNG